MMTWTVGRKDIASVKIHRINFINLRFLKFIRWKVLNNANFICYVEKNLLISFFFRNFAKLCQAISLWKASFSSKSLLTAWKQKNHSMILYKINPLKMYFFTQWRRPIAYNVVAAWRRRGFHYTWYEAQNLKIPTTFRTSDCPACAKPLVIGWSFLLLFVSIQRNLKRRFSLNSRHFYKYISKNVCTNIFSKF